MIKERFDNSKILAVIESEMHKLDDLTTNEGDNNEDLSEKTEKEKC
jgi:hypothetical protein